MCKSLYGETGMSDCSGQYLSYLISKGKLPVKHKAVHRHALCSVSGATLNRGPRPEGLG